MIKGTDDTRYAFVTGKVRAREARLLTRSVFDRLLAGPLSSFSTLLTDTAYASRGTIEAGLVEEEIAISNFFHEYCITPQIINLVNWPQQIHNLKVKLKKGSEELLYKQQESEVEEWPEVREEISRFIAEKDLFLLSTNLDRILCAHISETAQFVPFFSQYYTLNFDLENIRSFFRARQFEHSHEIFDQVFIPFGSVEYYRFINAFNIGYAEVSKAFQVTPYYTVIEKGAVYLQQYNSFVRLERLCEEKRLGFLLQARRMVFGVEPLFAYYHFKRNEIKKLRQVYYGKLNEMTVGDIKESVPDVW